MANPGKYNDRLQWYVYSLADENEHGEKEITYTLEKTLWCLITKPRPNERYYAGAINTVVDCVVLVRGELDITTLDEFRDSTWVYKITGISPSFNETICFCTRTKQ